MSLILRRTCQPILDKAGMQNFHIEMNEQQRVMEITTECGKSIVSVKGVNFSRKSPGKAEIEYAAELLEAFIMKYKKAILKYVALKDVYDAIAPVPMYAADESYKILYQRILTKNGSDYNYTIEYKDAPFLISLNTDGEVTNISIDLTTTTGITAILKKKFNRTKAIQATDILAAFIYRKEEAEKLEKVSAKLNECKI